MRRITVALIATLGFAVIVSPVGAKELHSAKICGKTRCVVAKDKHDIRAFAFTGSETDDPPSGPFYTVELSVLDDLGDKHSWTIDYMPGAALIRVNDEFGGDTWYELAGDATNREIKGMIGRLSPYPGNAFDAAMERPPGTFTHADLADLPSSEPAAPPASAPRPDPTDNEWLLPLIVLAAAAGLITGGLAVSRRRVPTA